MSKYKRRERHRVDQRSNAVKIVGLMALARQQMLNRYPDLFAKDLEVLACGDTLARANAYGVFSNMDLIASTGMDRRALFDRMGRLVELGYINHATWLATGFGGSKMWELTGRGEYALQYLSRVLLKMLA